MPFYTPGTSQRTHTRHTTHTSATPALDILCSSTYTYRLHTTHTHTQHTHTRTASTRPAQGFLLLRSKSPAPPPSPLALPGLRSPAGGSSLMTCVPTVPPHRAWSPGVMTLPMATPASPRKGQSGPSEVINSRSNSSKNCHAGGQAGAKGINSDNPHSTPEGKGRCLLTSGLIKFTDPQFTEARRSKNSSKPQTGSRSGLALGKSIQKCFLLEFPLWHGGLRT